MGKIPPTQWHDPVGEGPAPQIRIRIRIEAGIAGGSNEIHDSSDRARGETHIFRYIKTAISNSVTQDYQDTTVSYQDVSQ